MLPGGAPARRAAQPACRHHPPRRPAQLRRRAAPTLNLTLALALTLTLTLALTLTLTLALTLTLTLTLTPTLTLTLTLTPALTLALTLTLTLTGDEQGRRRGEWRAVGLQEHGRLHVRVQAAQEGGEATQARRARGRPWARWAQRTLGEGGRPRGNVTVAKAAPQRAPFHTSRATCEKMPRSEPRMTGPCILLR